VNHFTHSGGQPIDTLRNRQYTPHLLTGVWFGLDHPAPIMRDGFGGTVAVPAWARFMSAATKGSKPDWYRMPSDVEKVRMCRSSGMRAGSHCEGERLDLPAPPGEPMTIDARYAPQERAPGDMPPEPNVYEDLFPVGAVPAEDLHASRFGNAESRS
jgi:membrane carboxypeptidase/penicillin-binding protein